MKAQKYVRNISPKARLLEMLSRGGSSVSVSHSAHFVSSSALCADRDISWKMVPICFSLLWLCTSPHMRQLGWCLAFLPRATADGKRTQKTDFPQNITCFYGVCYSHPGEGGCHFLQWKGIGKKASLLQPENLLCIARNSQGLESFTNLFSSCYKNDNDDKLPVLDEVCRELHKPHPGCSTALLTWGQRRFHILFAKQQTGGVAP